MYFLHLVLEFLRIERLQAGLRAVGVDGRLGIAQQRCNLFRGVDAETYQRIDAQFRSQDSSLPWYNLAARDKQSVKLLHEGREDGQEGGVEDIVETLPLLLAYAVAAEFPQETVPVPALGFAVQVLAVLVQSVYAAVALKDELRDVGVLDVGCLAELPVYYRKECNTSRDCICSFFCFF